MQNHNIYKGITYIKSYLMKKTSNPTSTASLALSQIGSLDQSPYLDINVLEESHEGGVGGSEETAGVSVSEEPRKATPGAPKKKPELSLRLADGKGRTTIVVPSDLLVRLNLFSQLHRHRTGERLTRGELLRRLFTKGAPKVSPQAWEDFRTLFSDFL